MILGRVRPSIYLPTLAILWGVAAACQGACQNWHQIVGLRFLIGFFESGFAPGCAFYLSSWYRKYELASRYAWLYTSVAVAGAVSGLLAGVITEFMDGAAGIAGWRWLFVSIMVAAHTELAHCHVANHAVLHRSSKAWRPLFLALLSCSSCQTTQLPSTANSSRRKSAFWPAIDLQSTVWGLRKARRKGLGSGRL